jgi:aminopeptidase
MIIMTASDFEQNLQKYADLIVKVGLNLQPGQRLNVYAPLDTAPLVRRVAACAYQQGCRFVDAIYHDDALQPIRFQYAPRDSFEEYPTWIANDRLEYFQRGDASLQILASDPDLLRDQDPELVAIAQRTHSKYIRPIRDLITRNATNWAIVSYPVPSWASRLFPNDPPEQQVARLWEAIFEVCRVNVADPIAAWQAHIAGLAARADYLSAKHYAGLKYHGPGTDLYIGLAGDHRWVSGTLESQAGITFVANLPTEEVFSLPHKDQTHGTVTATKPLSHQGTLIEDFSLTFEQGRVINVTASRGETILRKLIETDEGAGRLGEAALVPHHSPVSQSGILFHNTLFDENAASHIALGHGLKFALPGGEQLSDDDFARRGGNLSDIHVDFMIGSSEIAIDGVAADGASEPVMRQGEWAFET